MSEHTDLEKLKQEVENLKETVEKLELGMRQYVRYVGDIYNQGGTFVDHMTFMQNYYDVLEEKDGMYNLIHNFSGSYIDDNTLDPVFAEYENDFKEMKKQIKIRKEKEIRESDERMAKLIARDEERRKRFEEETNTFAVGGEKNS